MNKIVLLYTSIHHNNTKKVVEYVASHFSYEIDVKDIIKEKSPDISDSEWIIFASGIYFNSIHKNMTNYINGADLSGKKVIILYTCGLNYKNYTKATAKQLTERNAEYIGCCHCRGFDTFGPLEKIGGIAKKHPNNADMEKILNSINHLIHSNN